MHHIFRLMRDRKGATAIEYGLIITLIAIVAAASIGAVGTAVKKPFTNVSSNMPVG